MFRNVKDYIIDKEFRFIVYKNKVNIINYNNILSIEKERISVSYPSGILVIKGKDLTLKKMLDDEVLIYGNIKSVELGDWNVF